MTSEQVLFARDPGEAPETSASSIQADGPPSRFQRYLAEIHLLLVVVLVILSVIIGAIGFALRPGTDEPPAVSNANLTLYVYEQKSPSAIPNDPARVDVDEIMMQDTSSIVLMQIDLFATFPKAGAAHWELGTSISQSQPYPCPDPYTYLGTAQPDPVSINNAQFTIGNHPVNRAGIANFVGHRSTRTAANVLGLYGQSPSSVQIGRLSPIAEIDLCWTRNLPMAFDGEYASAALPAVAVVSETTGMDLPINLTRSLYFENIRQPHQPITAEYSLQAGTLPTSTDPSGWHWSGGQRPGSVELTAVDISISQHEAYLGFLSGVLFGIVGGALVLILQEILEPVRVRRRARGSATTHTGTGQ
jgi:hypothetical protein